MAWIRFMPQGAQQAQSQNVSRQTSSASRRPGKRLSMSSLMAYAPARPRVPSLLNIFRIVLYVAVIVFSFICLGIAAHFFHMLQASSLTRFVPFALFVCSVSLVMFPMLLLFTLRKEANPISTRIELGCLALAGVLWLSLGAFMATSDSESAEVECFSDASDTTPIDLPSFSTETYHAQYRVLEAFSLFNVALILGFLLFMTALAVRHHLNGSTEVWRCPVPMYGWFTRTAKNAKGLPAPAVQRSRSKTRPDPRPVQHPARQDSGRSGKTFKSTNSSQNSRTMLLPQMKYQPGTAPVTTSRTMAAASRPPVPAVSRPSAPPAPRPSAQAAPRPSAPAPLLRSTSQPRPSAPQPMSKGGNRAPIYDRYRRDASPKRDGPRDKYRRDASPRR